MQLTAALAQAYAALVEQSELIDSINVFPVADGDTGTNLRVSLAPLCQGTGEPVARELLLSATGNSGNIAAAFFRCLVLADRDQLAQAAAKGSKQADRAVADPQAGTMLSVFSALAEGLRQGADIHMLEQQLRQAVLSGPQLLPLLQKAQVVDAGALAMYIFFTAFLQHLEENPWQPPPIQQVFGGQLALKAGYQPTTGRMYCVDAILDTGRTPAPEIDELSELGESLVAAADNNRLKIHIHTDEPARLRSRLATLGEIVNWSDEKIAPLPQDGHIRLLLDAAGSLSPQLAAENGISLVANSIVVGDKATMETDCNNDEIYSLLRRGIRVGTARMPLEKRHPFFTAPVSGPATRLYLCVGSAYTGNFAAATAWKEHHDPDDRFLIMDTGAASGRLGIIGLLTARYARRATGSGQILTAVQQLMQTCGELVFIDELKYLARGGRISKAGGFFGDLLHVKPIISPEAAGVRKCGVVRNRAGQLVFLQRRLQRLEPQNLVLLLEYSENRAWLEKTVLPLVQRLQPAAEIHIVPLSLTSGVHMGPGTWGVAWGYPVDQL